MLDDGTAGLAAIKARAGFAVVQDPDEAAFSDMPRNAIENVSVDAIVPAASIGGVIVDFAQRAAALRAMPLPASEDRMQPSLFSCPDCGGVLSEIDADGVTRFRCRTGHSYSPRTLFTLQEHGLEAALWVALRALEERRDLSERLALRSQERGLTVAANRLRNQAAVAARRAETIRAAIEGPQAAIDTATAAADVDDVPRRPTAAEGD